MIREIPDHNDDRTSIRREDDDRYLPARMINEVVYCPRLFYLMYVEGQFEHNAETTAGQVVHQRVDARTDELKAPSLDGNNDSNADPIARQPLLLGFDEQTGNNDCDMQQQGSPQNNGTSPDTSINAEQETIHARSVTLASDRLGVIAKLDLVEAEGQCATPVDYKKGRPRRAEDGTLTAWAPERIQLCLQALVLRENGFQCNEGVIYFYATRQRVTVPIDDQLVEQAERAVEKARRVAEALRPPAPLVDSPKCPKCSLSAICLPDETNRLRVKQDGTPQGAAVRLPATPRDDLRPLYLNTQGLVVGRQSELLQIKEQGKLVQQVRLREINQVNLFGNIQLSTQAMQALLERNTPLVLHSQHGYFYGMLQGTGLKNILLRREQFRLADDPARCLSIAKSLVAGKIRNQRVMLMRNHVAPPRDPVNSLLSLAYALLAKDLTVTAAAVGFDPYLGFYHLPRPGRPALSLDLMEPFRPILADSVVITAINNRMVYPEHFIAAGKGVELTPSGRKAFFRAYEQRMDQLVTHPLFDYRVSYRRLLEIQTRLMARVVSGEVRDYPVFVTR